MQRRGGNIPPPPKGGKPQISDRRGPRLPARSRRTQKTKKTQSQSPVLRPFPAHRVPSRYDSSPKTSGRNSGACPCSAHRRRSRPASCSADHYVLPLWLLVGGFLVCGILALLADDRGANLATLGAILLFGMTVTDLRHTPAPPTGTPGEYEIIVRERLSERGRQNGLRHNDPRPAELRNRRMAPRRRKPRGAMRLFDRTESRRPSRRTRQNLPFHRPSRRLRTARRPAGDTSAPST